MPCPTLGSIMRGCYNALGTNIGDFADRVEQACGQFLDLPLDQIPPNAQEALLGCLAGLSINLRSVAGTIRLGDKQEELYRLVRQVNQLGDQLAGVWKQTGTKRKGAGSRAGAK